MSDKLPTDKQAEVLATLDGSGILQLRGDCIYGVGKEYRTVPTSTLGVLKRNEWICRADPLPNYMIFDRDRQRITRKGRAALARYRQKKGQN